MKKKSHRLGSLVVFFSFLLPIVCRRRSLRQRSCSTSPMILSTVSPVMSGLHVPT